MTILAHPRHCVHQMDTPGFANELSIFSERMDLVFFSHNHTETRSVSIKIAAVTT